MLSSSEPASLDACGDEVEHQHGRTDGRTYEEGCSAVDQTDGPYRANDPVDIPLFDMEPVAASPQTEPVEKLSADRRRTIRQREAIESGLHPLAAPLRHPIRLHPEQGRKCGNCRFRISENPGNGRSFPKCWLGNGRRITGGAATDVRAWWPGCTDHEWGDPKLSPDAARCVPEDTA